MSEVHVLYRFYNASRELLYVGITAKPTQRFRSHQKTKDWWPEVDGITVENFESRPELAHAEWCAITSEKPLYNIRHNDQSADAAAMPSPGRKHTLAQATRIICGEDGAGMANPQHWVMCKLRAGRFPGLKIGRNWFMTDADVEAAQATLRNDPKPLPAPAAALNGTSGQILDGLSERAARRLNAVRA